MSPPKVSRPNSRPIKLRWRNFIASAAPACRVTIRQSEAGQKLQALQAPRSSETPSSKPQSEQPADSCFGAWCLELFWSLELLRRQPCCLGGEATRSRLRKSHNSAA